MPVLRSSTRQQSSRSCSPRNGKNLVPNSSRKSQAKISKGVSKPTASKSLSNCDVIEISSDEDFDLSQRAIIADLRKQNAELKDEVSKHKHVLGRLDITKIEEDLNCEICATRMWSPCVLAACGHTFCQSCLQDWFTTILTKFIADNPGYNLPINPVRMHSARPGHAFKPDYSCPTCRVTVSTKPVEVYALKAIVRAVASASGEKSPQKNKGMQIGRKGNTSAGIWDHFFPVQKSMS